VGKPVGSFHTLRFGESRPFTGSCHKGQLDLFYYRDPGLISREVVPFVDYSVKQIKRLR
jgi:hypothetical protein